MTLQRTISLSAQLDISETTETHDFRGPTDLPAATGHDPLLMELVETPAFQRLKEIRFLGSLDRTADPGQFDTRATSTVSASWSCRSGTAANAEYRSRSGVWCVRPHCCTTLAIPLFRTPSSPYSKRSSGSTTIRPPKTSFAAEFPSVRRFLLPCATMEWTWRNWSPLFPEKPCDSMVSFAVRSTSTPLKASSGPTHTCSNPPLLLVRTG